MSSISALSLRIPVWSPTLLGLDFPLRTLIGIIGKRKHFLTCTQKTTRAKLERLPLVRLIQGGEKITTRYAKALNKAYLITLIASRLGTIKHVN
jgi:hypothetical protein